MMPILTNETYQFFCFILPAICGILWGILVGIQLKGNHDKIASGCLLFCIGFLAHGYRNYIHFQIDSNHKLIIHSEEQWLTLFGYTAFMTATIIFIFNARNNEKK